jgi:hypothetical protein
MTLRARLATWLVRYLHRHDAVVLAALGGAELSTREVAAAVGRSLTGTHLTLLSLEETGAVLSRWEDPDGPIPRRRVYRAATPPAPRLVRRPVGMEAS